MQREVSRFLKLTTRFVIGFAFLLAAMGGCTRPPDEVLMRSEIEAMKNAAEARQAGDLLDRIADDFSGNKGEVDRQGLSRMIKLEFLRNEAIGVALGPITVEVDGDRAVARFDVTFRDASRRWLPGGSDTVAVVSGWRRSGSRWICYNATWTQKD